MKCPKCTSGSVVKNGLRKKEQSFLCKECGVQFTNTETQKTIINKRLATELYLEGLSLRQIAAIIGVHNTTILYWLKEFGEPLDKIKNKEKCRFVEARKEQLTLTFKRALIINIDDGSSLFFQQKA